MNPEIVIEKNKNELIAKLASEIIGIINNSSKESIHIALSGGSTPKALYEFIAEQYHDAVDWSKVYFWWGDERCVPPDNDESNYKMAKVAMLDKLKIPYRHIIRIEGETNPENEVVNYNETISKKLPFRNSLPVFDIVLLGLGDDGHTLSIFPDQIELFSSKRFAEVAVHPETKQNRITLTGSVVNNADNVFFLVTGKTKAKVVSEIINKQGDYKNYPASLILPNKANFKWYLDAEAAEKL